MQLDEIAQKHKIKCVDTKKLFWGLYGYSLSVPIPQKFISKKEADLAEYNQKIRGVVSVLQSSVRLIRRMRSSPFSNISPNFTSIINAYNTRVETFGNKILDANEDILGPDGYYYQFNPRNMTIYLSDEATVIKLIERNPKLFQTISRPKTEQVAEFITREKGVEVKEREWFGKFDYRVKFNFDPTNYDSLDERVENLNLVESLYSVGELTRTLYVKGEDDFFLIKLALGDQIESVSRCIKRSDVENNIQK